MDDLDAPEPIYIPSIGLRALWRNFSVVVRVHSGALGRDRPLDRPLLRGPASQPYNHLWLSSKAGVCLKPFSA